MGNLINCNLKQIRKKHRLPQWKLALFTDISASTLSLIEHGLPPAPKIQSRIAEYFGVDIDDIWPSEGVRKQIS